LREERRLRVFENRVLRRIFGPKRDDVIGEWRKLHKEELHDLYCSPTILRGIKSRSIRWAGHVARMREVRGVYRGLVGKPEGKRPLGKPCCRWEDNIKMEAHWLLLVRSYESLPERRWGRTSTRYISRVDVTIVNFRARRGCWIISCGKMNRVVKNYIDDDIRLRNTGSLRSDYNTESYV
jgi:hypothetical protein